MEFKAIPDKELIERALNGEESALTALFERHQEGLKIYISKIVSSSDVEDICMQAFQKAFEHLDIYDETRSIFKTWLYTIAKNISIDHLSKQEKERKRLPTTSLDDGEQRRVLSVEMLDNEISVVERITSEEDIATLTKAIEGLSPLYSGIAKERFLEEKEYEEIASLFNLPVNTVKTRIKRAREMLLEVLSEK